MLLKGLVFQSMPQTTMIAAIAGVLRGPSRDRTPPLSDVRNYLKTQVAIEKGNLKIGKLIMEEIGRQNACHSERRKARATDGTLTIALTVKQSNLNRDGERTNKERRERDSRREDPRVTALATSIFEPLDGVMINITGSTKYVSTSDGSLAPSYRTLRAEVQYSTFLVHRIPGTCDFQFLQVDRYPTQIPEDAVRTAMGALVTRGHSVTFDHHTVTMMVDGVRLTPVEVVQKVTGGEIHLVSNPQKT